jgi:hypothetical protein
VDLQRLLDDSNRAGVEFLIVDTAHAILDGADAYTQPDHIKQARQHARSAYDTIVRLMPRVRLDEAQGAMIEKKLARLRSRLEAAGERF